MFPSTSSNRSRVAFAIVAAVLVGGACATLEMPTPVKRVKTTNLTAPSYEYHPPPMPDASAGDAAVPDAATVSGADAQTQDAQLSGDR